MVSDSKKFKSVIGQNSNVPEDPLPIALEENVRKRKSSFADVERTKSLERAVFGGTSQFSESNFSELLAKKESKKSKTKENLEQLPAWHDSDDESSEIPKDVKIARKFLTTPASSADWATQPANDADEDSELGTRSERLIVPNDRVAKLKSSQFLVRKCADLNRDCPTEAAVNAVRFHPVDRLALVGSEDGALNVFRVDVDYQAKAATVNFESFAVKFAEFLPTSKKILATSVFKTFYTYDYGSMVLTPHHGLRNVEDRIFSKFEVSNCGKFIAMKGFYGRVHIIRADNFQLVHTVTLNEFVEGISFTSDSSYLICSDCKGYVYIYDLRKLTRCLKKFQDEGSTNTVSVALSKDSSLIACGSFNGIVNIYDFQSILRTADKFPEPTKCFKNLSTLIDNVQFNSTNEFCIFSSRMVKNSVRVIHLDSLSVFPDFPPKGQNLGCIKTLHISPNSKYLAFGASKGKARLYDVSQYCRY